MNRKIAVAAIVGGLMHTVSLLRGQEPQPTVSRMPAGDPLEEIRKQVAELTRRLELLERTNANSMSFAKVGNDFVFAPPSGNVFIKAPAGLTIQGAGSLMIQGAMIDVVASGTLAHKGALLKLN